MQTRPYLRLLSATPINTKEYVSDSLKAILQDIVLIEAHSNYSKLYLKNGKSLLVSQTLAYFENILSAYGFVRVHKSFVINISHIKELSSTQFITMTNGQTIEVARRRRREVKETYINWWTK